ncbi:fungal-specific transcription factor domain-containing protein [Aspergillus floccosus]
MGNFPTTAIESGMILASFYNLVMEPVKIAHIAVACNSCRRRKIKCHYVDEGSACRRCVGNGMKCSLYNPNRSRDEEPNGAPRRNTVLEKGAGRLETTKQLHPSSPHIGPKLSFITKLLELDECEFLNQMGTPYEDYAFLELPGVERLSTSQIEHLRAQGWLSLPPQELLDHLVCCYFRFVHCHVPLLNEAEFWPAYRSSSSGSPSTRYTSLFVFQAVLFCSIAYIPLPLIHRLGYASRELAQAAFHLRAKLLYELEAETDPLYLAQGCLLSRHTTGARPNQASEWLTIAINKAVSIQAHRANKSRSDKETNNNVKSRLWWSIIIRDRSLSLGLRRRILVAPPMLDLSIEPPCESDFQDEILSSRVHSPLNRRRFVHMLRAQVKLSLILTELLGHATDSDVDEKDKSALNIEPHARETQVLSSVSSKLCDWLGDTKDGLLLFEDIALQPLTQPTNLYSCLILLQFHAATNVLYYRQIQLIVQRQPLTSEDSRQLSGIFNGINIAVCSINYMIRKMVQSGWAHQLPLTLTVYIALPFLLNSLNFVFSSEDQRLQVYEDTLQYYICLMNNLQATHQAARFLAETIQALVRATEDSLMLERPEISSPSSGKWRKIFVYRPHIFLRVCWALDLAIASGQVADRYTVLKQISQDSTSLALEVQLVSGGLSAPRDILSPMNSNAHVSSNTPQILHADELLSQCQFDFTTAGSEGPALRWWLDSALNEMLGCIPP